MKTAPRKRLVFLSLLLLIVAALCLVPWPKLFPQLFEPRRAPSAAEAVSSDPTVLQVEIFLPSKQNIGMGSNMMMGSVDGKTALVTELHPAKNPTAEVEVGDEAAGVRVTASLLGHRPPYAVEFQRKSVSATDGTPAATERVDFPESRLTHVRVFDLLDVRGFYGNSARKRPKAYQAMQPTGTILVSTVRGTRESVVQAMRAPLPAADLVSR